MLSSAMIAPVLYPAYERVRLSPPLRRKSYRQADIQVPRPSITYRKIIKISSAQMAHRIHDKLDGFD